MTTELIEKPAIEPKPVVLTSLRPTPDDLLAAAVQQGAGIEYLERLLTLKERHEANEARKAFVTAMTLFKREPLTIFKRKQVGYTTKDGDFVGYKHAELSDVASVVVPAMARHGLSHRWDVSQDAGRIKVRCIVTHEFGHAETVELDGAPDNSGKKNSIQQVASTVTYLQRYTLLLATGLATQDQIDDDGAGAGGDEQGDADADLMAKAAEAADRGIAVYGAWWREAGAKVRTTIGAARHETLKARATEADKRAAGAQGGAE